jgi:adenine-specific DNA-methyltransferase
MPGTKRAKSRSPTAERKKRPLHQYEHTGKQRTNNPPVGLVDAKSDPVEGKKTYAYDPHLDPTLVWAGKAERTSFDVPTVSLHVHERIDPRSIIEAVRKKNGSDYEQLSLFRSPAENPPLREAIEFYKHAHNWTNRLVAGDSALVMNSMIEKEGMAGQVQMVYFDPPYGIKYGSNFQPFVNKRDVKDGKDEDLTAEPEMVKAFRDTWELGIHSYLAYLRDRLLLARELLHETGSVFVQISDENAHHVREILDEVFGVGNFVAEIAFKKTGYQASGLLPSNYDYVCWYARDRAKVKYRQLHISKLETAAFVGQDLWVEQSDGSRRRLTEDEASALARGEDVGKVFRHKLAEGAGASGNTEPFEFQGRAFRPKEGKHWSTTPKGMGNLGKAKRFIIMGNSLRYVNYLSDFPVTPITSIWPDTVVSGFSEPQQYVVQTATKAVSRCVLMTTDPGDLVLDITCGSGTTAYVAEQWGRRWITCDTSRVALTLAKQRLMTAVFDYYRLAHPDEGVGSGFVYETVPHVTLKSIANNEPPNQETLYDRPLLDTSRARVTGPFTVEAVPAPMVKSPAELADEETAAPAPADESVSRSGETVRQDEWRSELLRTGIRGKRGQMIRFSRVEPMSGTRWLHADAETKPNDEGPARVREGAAAERQRVVVSFGPEHAPLEQRQVEQAVEEARKLVPRPDLIVFAAFQFDPEAAKDIDELNWPGVTLLKAKMNDDLLTADLKKKRASNESFWLIGQPDVRLRRVKAEGKRKKAEKNGEKAQELWQVEVAGFDYYNTKTGQIESGGAGQIAVWMLDTEYDGRSLFPRQVFFPMAGEKDGWAKLAKNLKAEIDEELIEAYRDTVSLPFAAGKNRRAAVKIVDDRGIESLKIVELEG